MDRWNGKVAVVTGANSGMGEEVSKRLVKCGMQVIGADLFTNQIDENARQLKGEKGSLTAYKLNLTKDDEVQKMFDFIASKFKVAHVVVNSAGLADNKKILSSSPNDWRKMSEINVIALTHVMKLAINLMRKNGVDDGHVVNISSVAGHRVQPRLPFYSGTKIAVRAVAEAVRQELREAKSNIRITGISPGLVWSKLYENSNFTDDFIEDMYAKNAYIHPSDIADTIIHTLSAPQRVQVTEAIVAATGQVFGPM